MRRGELPEILAGLGPDEQMGQPIGACIDRIERLFERTDVHYDKFPSLVRGDGQRPQGFLSERGDGLPGSILQPVIVNRLYVVGSLADPCVYPRFCFLGPGYGWHFPSVLGPVASSTTSQHAARYHF